MVNDLKKIPDDRNAQTWEITNYACHTQHKYIYFLWAINFLFWIVKGINKRRFHCSCKWPLAKPGSDRIGPDRTGSTIGSDRIDKTRTKSTTKSLPNFSRRSPDNVLERGEVELCVPFSLVYSSPHLLRLVEIFFSQGDYRYQSGIMKGTMCPTM